MTYRLSTLLQVVTLFAVISWAACDGVPRYQRWVTKAEASAILLKLSQLSPMPAYADISPAKFIRYMDLIYELEACQDKDIEAFGAPSVEVILQATPSCVDGDIELLYGARNLLVEFLMRHPSGEQGHRLIAAAMTQSSGEGPAELAMSVLSEFADPFDEALFELHRNSPNEIIASSASSGLERLARHNHPPSFSESYQRARH